MTRAGYFACLGVLASGSCLFGQSTPASGQQNSPQPVQVEPQAKSQTQSVPEEELPPEEDESVAPEKFVLNPLESDRNIKVGNFYWHKGDFRAALHRYERATKFNPSSAEAFFKVGEAEEKLKNKQAAATAFQRVIQLAPDSKLAREAKKKLGNKG